MILRYTITQDTPGGILWLARPSQSLSADRLARSTWTSVEADAFRWPTAEAAEDYIKGTEPAHPTLVWPLMVLETDDRYSISEDPVVPKMIVQETSRSQLNPKTGKTRITYKGVL